MSRRPPRPLGRASPGSAPRRIAVFTEGKKTEPDYLAHWHRAHRDRVQVAISGDLGAPMTVVNSAIEQKRDEAKEARRGRGRASDEYWCVIDVDQHPNSGSKRWIRIYCCSIIIMEMPMSNSPRRTAARPADRLGTARADLRKRYTTTSPDDTTEVVEETSLEPHERALLDDPGLHGALSEGLANLHLATPLDEDLLDPSQYTPAEAFPPGEYLRDEFDERGWTVAQFAEMIDQPLQAVSEILDAKTGITAETALSISEALGTSAELWLNLETTYRRHQQRLAADLGAHDR